MFILLLFVDFAAGQVWELIFSAEKIEYRMKHILAMILYGKRDCLQAMERWQALGIVVSMMLMRFTVVRWTIQNVIITRQMAKLRIPVTRLILTILHARTSGTQVVSGTYGLLRVYAIEKLRQNWDGVWIFFFLFIFIFAIAPSCCLVISVINIIKACGCCKPKRTQQEQTTIINQTQFVPNTVPQPGTVIQMQQTQ